MSSIKTLYTGTNEPPVRPLTKGSLANIYKNAYFGEINKDDIKIENSIKKLYNIPNHNQIKSNVQFISYNDDYSLPKKPKVLYPKKNQNS